MEWQQAENGDCGEQFATFGYSKSFRKLLGGLVTVSR